MQRKLKLRHPIISEVGSIYWFSVHGFGFRGEPAITEWWPVSYLCGGNIRALMLVLTV